MFKNVVIRLSKLKLYLKKINNFLQGFDFEAFHALKYFRVESGLNSGKRQRVLYFFDVMKTESIYFQTHYTL